MGNSMGSSGSSNAAAANRENSLTGGASTSANSFKNRRGSKVFARFSQKKITKESRSQQTVSEFDSLEVDVLEQQHAAVLRELQNHQLQSAKKPSAKKRRKKFFCRHSQHDDNESNTNDDDDDGVHPIASDAKPHEKFQTKQKRQAPKPPGQAKPLATKSPGHSKSPAPKPPVQTRPQQNEEPKITHNPSDDHREFIAQLFSDAVDEPELEDDLYEDDLNDEYDCNEKYGLREQSNGTSCHSHSKSNSKQAKTPTDSLNVAQTKKSTARSDSSGGGGAGGSGVSSVVAVSSVNNDKEVIVLQTDSWRAANVLQAIQIHQKSVSPGPREFVAADKPPEADATNTGAATIDDADLYDGDPDDDDDDEDSYGRDMTMAMQHNSATVAAAARLYNNNTTNVLNNNNNNMIVGCIDATGSTTGTDVSPLTTPEDVLMKTAISSSSSDSLFTDPLSSNSINHQHPQQQQQQQQTPNSILHTLLLQHRQQQQHNNQKEHQQHQGQQQTAAGRVEHHPPQTPTSPALAALAEESRFLCRGLNEVPSLTNGSSSGRRATRPLSEISVNSSDTWGLLSPTTIRAVAELRKRHQADKLAQLSLTDIQYWHNTAAAAVAAAAGGCQQQGGTPPIDPTRPPGSQDPSPDEQMALHLGKKLAQVLSGGGSGGGSPTPCPTLTANDIIVSPSVVGTPTTVTAAAVTPSATTTPTSEMFNIAKAKKIELQNLSSRLRSPGLSGSAGAGSDTDLKSLTASTEAKHLPSSTETQSTVIISFKSSQTPVQSQQQQQQQQPGNTSNNLCSSTETVPTSDTTTVAPPTPSAAASATGTANSNVLKKVATFTVEGKGGGSGSGPGSGTPSTTSNGATGCGSAIADAQRSLGAVAAGASASASSLNEQIGNTGTPRRSSYVPEKLHFAAYDKFEGQMLMKWLIASFQASTGVPVASDASPMPSIGEQEVNRLVLLCCKNLLNCGVLKRITTGERKDSTEAPFSPFEMYQWTHAEAPVTSIPLTPGRLDKSSVWPYCSTPTQSTRSMPRTAQVDTTTPVTSDQTYLQQLRRRLMNCSSLTEVQEVVDEMLTINGPQRRPSKKCVHLTELLNASDTTLFEADRRGSKSEASASDSKDVQDVGVQVELLTGEASESGAQDSEANAKESPREAEKSLKDASVQTEVPQEEAAAAAVRPAPPAPPPPPPPPPMPSAGGAAPPPPPPPMPEAATSIPPPPPVPPPIPSAQAPPPPPPLGPLKTSADNPEGTAKSPSLNTPTPLPNPAEGGWFKQDNVLRKTPVNPPKPMKPLYWTRIVTAAPPPKAAAPPAGDHTDSNASSPDDGSAEVAAQKQIWQEIEETSLDNIDEFTELFSRQAVVPLSKPKEKKEVRIKSLKVLDSKRSQNVGIVARSLHVDFCEIEHAIYHVDTSVVSLETLQQIINVKATNEELELINEAMQQGGGIPLDYPEKFLLKISEISMFADRVSCIVFQAEFEEASTLISRKLEIVAQLSQFLTESEDLKLVFSIILTLGNYMNGGNRQRGQADGFTLEILGKLKDVKSKDSHTTLLHFIIRTYINRRRNDGIQLLEIPLPIPEPADVERAAQVDFEEVKAQITELHKKLKVCTKTADNVMANSTADNLEPFKSKMVAFIEDGTKIIEKLHKELDECRDFFIETMRFYHFTPKSRPLEQSTPDQFFEHWTNFTNDFKDIWKREIALLWDELLKKSRQIQTQSRTNVKTTRAQPGGLKERIMRLRNRKQ